MKAARFFPLAFVANIHGFALLLPYLAVFMTVVWILTSMTDRAKTRAVPARIRVGGYARLTRVD